MRRLEKWVAGGRTQAWERSISSRPPLRRETSRSSASRSGSNDHSAELPTTTGPKGRACDPACTAPRITWPSPISRVTEKCPGATRFHAIS